ncbi:hypothetical protein Glove_140g144 [Diversispora epigaea]|uniref:MARVEL domain-containing protein n=1 Tax=Diversispora epigaea TaxID=1348612 RepID=A0A397IUZ8_9GLOM|nr:hypothetical protein Glove_140g144 [Diversispora epigaea]
MNLNLDNLYDNFVLRSTFQRWYRIIQLLLIIMITILELSQVSLYRTFSLKSKEDGYQVPGYFSPDSFSLFGVKPFVLLSCSVTLLFASIYVSLFKEIFEKENFKKFLFAIDILMVILWFATLLASYLPPKLISEEGEIFCVSRITEINPDYHNSDAKDLCNTYLISMGLGLILLSTFTLSTIFSWMIHKNEGTLQRIDSFV